MVAATLRRLLCAAARTAVLPARKRVFGVCAHVDAGKTTLSERMLYYAGALRRAGDVDAGDTALDFLPAERARGITIAAASVAADWRDTRLFLVDSPGHLDFTYEVQRALRVMDGAVVVLDAVAGVQPQTETVWRQADQYALPRVVFVNKMDRAGADFPAALAALRRRLSANPIALHMPVLVGPSASWAGFIDLLTLDRVVHAPRDAARQSMPPRVEARAPLREDEDAGLWAAAADARERMVEALADVDDHVMAAWVAGESLDAPALSAALRRATLSAAAVPVLCGSALGCTGVHAVLDAVVDYMPSPIDRKSIDVSVARPPTETGDLLALAFKVTHDVHRGRMVYMRAFCGSMEACEKLPLLNVSNGKKEIPTALLRVMADSVMDAGDVGIGDIFAVTGLKHTKTGDTVVARRRTVKKSKGSDDFLALEGVPSPPAVVSVAVEAESTSQQRKLDVALAQLLVEDPSLRLSTDSQSGETLLSGMGQLHLDVVVDRLSKQLTDVSIFVSQPRVAYRETIGQSHSVAESYDSVIGSARQFATFSLAVQPLQNHEKENVVIVQDSLAAERPDLADMVSKSLLTALARGAVLGSPTIGVQASVLSTAAELSLASTPAALTACISRAAGAALSAAHPVLLEPVMKICCNIPESSVAAVVGELTHPILRRGVVEDIQRGEDAVGLDTIVCILASVPLVGMVDWATRLRTLTKGRGDFTMEFSSYQPVGEVRQAELSPHR